jgi:hypothetical protein
MKPNEVLGRRLRAVRLEMYGENGAPLLAAQLGFPARTWLRYESGAPMPAEVVLSFVEMVGVEPEWLLTGEGRRYASATGQPPARGNRR